MAEELFADSIGNITVTGSVVRMDLVSASATERDTEGRPKMVFRQRVIMPVDAFGRSFGSMQRIMQQLIKAGVFKVQPTDAQGAPVSNDSGAMGTGQDT